MCSPACMERLFINLKVLSKIEKGQKLYTKDDYFLLDDGNSLKQTFTRWWNNESRERTLGKIQNVVRSSIHCGNNAMLSTKDESLQRNLWKEFLQLDTITFLSNLVDAMDTALPGLDNIKDTYRDDHTLCAKLDLEIELLRENIAKYRRYLTKKIQRNKNEPL